MARRPSRPRSPDIDIAASARTREVRFHDTSGVHVEFTGDPDGEFAAGSDRENLPAQVTEEIPYRDASVRWRVAASLRTARLVGAVEVARDRHVRR